MIRFHRRRYRARYTVALGLVLIPIFACTSVFESGDERADAANVFVTGTSTEPLMLILSNDFDTQPGDGGAVGVTLLSADTFTVNLPAPVERSYSFDESDRFLARLVNPDTASTADVHMRVLLDSDEVYNQQATLLDAELEFVFVYN